MKACNNYFGIQQYVEKSISGVDVIGMRCRYCKRPKNEHTGSLLGAWRSLSLTLRSLLKLTKVSIAWIWMKVK